MIDLIVSKALRVDTKPVNNLSELSGDYYIEYYDCPKNSSGRSSDIESVEHEQTEETTLSEDSSNSGQHFNEEGFVDYEFSGHLEEESTIKEPTDEEHTTEQQTNEDQTTEQQFYLKQIIEVQTNQEEIIEEQTYQEQTTEEHTNEELANQAIGRSIETEKDSNNLGENVFNGRSVSIKKTSNEGMAIQGRGLADPSDPILLAMFNLTIPIKLGSGKQEPPKIQKVEVEKSVPYAIYVPHYVPIEKVLQKKVAVPMAVSIDTLNKTLIKARSGDLPSEMSQKELMEVIQKAMEEND